MYFVLVSPYKVLYGYEVPPYFVLYRAVSSLGFLPRRNRSKTSTLRYLNITKRPHEMHVIGDTGSNASSARSLSCASQLTSQRSELADLHTMVMDNLFDLFPQESVPKPRPPRSSRRRSSGGSVPAGALADIMSLEYYSKGGKKRKSTALDVPRIQHLDVLIREGKCFDPLVFEFDGDGEISERENGGESRRFRGGKRSRDRRGSVQRHLNSAAMSTLSAGEIKNMKNVLKVKKQDEQVIKEKESATAEMKGGKGKEKRSKRHSLSDEMDIVAAAVAKGATVSRTRLRVKFLQEFITMTRFEETQLTKLASGLKVHGGIDGLIDKPGFIAVLSHFYERILIEVSPESMARGFLEHMFDVLDDVDKDGMIDFREFAVSIAGQLGCSLRRKVKVLFNVYDLDNDGAITIHELCDIIHKGHDATWELVDYTENFFELMDEDGDGQITWQEFRGAVIREPLVLESFSRCLAPGIVYGELDRKAMKMLFVRLNLNWSMLKEIYLALKSTSVEYQDRESERLAALRKEIALQKAEEQKKSARDWKKRVSLVGGGFGMKITDDILDGDAAVTLVDFEDDDRGKRKNGDTASSVDTEDAEDSVRSALKSRCMLDVESFQKAMFNFLLPPQPGDGQLVR